MSDRKYKRYIELTDMIASHKALETIAINARYLALVDIISASGVYRRVPGNEPHKHKYICAYIFTS